MPSPPFWVSVPLPRGVLLQTRHHEGKLTNDELREKQGQTQEKWGEAKDKADDLEDKVDERV
jgi:hypothetical protein